MKTLNYESLRVSLRWYKLRATLISLALRDLIFPRKVTGDCPVSVSLTTYSKRLQTVHTTIQSIVQGKVRPKRLILWLDGDPHKQVIPLPLQRLAKRGLEIIYVKNFGPHKKYFPYVCAYSDEDVPLVAADDDVI